MAIPEKATTPALAASVWCESGTPITPSLPDKNAQWMLTFSSVADDAKVCNRWGHNRSAVLSNALAATPNPNDSRAYLINLLKGDYPAAALIAFNQAKAAPNDVVYKQWIMYLSGVVRASDQCYNGRAVDVIKWANGDAVTNPIPDLLPALQLKAKPTKPIKTK